MKTLITTLLLLTICNISFSQEINITPVIGPNVTIPIDISLNLAISKEIEIVGRPLEISLYVQPSVTKWNLQNGGESEYYSRHFTGGIRAAYFFLVR